MFLTLLTVALLLVLLAAFGSWLVHQADTTFAKTRTCRYRDFHKLQKRAERISLGYVFTGLVGIAWYPAGLAVTLWVFGYALYRRIR